MATKKASGRKAITRGISFRQDLLDKAAQRAAADQRSLSNYICSLIERDIARGNESKAA